MPSDTGDAEWWLDYTDYHYWHYHNKYPEGGGGIDSIGINSYGKCEFYSAAEGKQASDAPDKGGRGYGYCGLEEYHHCPYNWTAYWREKNYIYKDVLIKRFTHIAEHIQYIHIVILDITIRI